MTEIRRATADDAHALAAAGEAFFRESAYSSVCSYDVESAERFVRMLAEQGAVFVAEAEDAIVGFIGGIVSGMWFNAAVKPAAEMAWWVDEGQRGSRTAIRLYFAFEEWAKEVGATHVVMSDLLAIGNDRAGDIYARLGFTAVERSHIKGV